MAVHLFQCAIVGAQNKALGSSEVLASLITKAECPRFGKAERDYSGAAVALRRGVNSAASFAVIVLDLAFAGRSGVVN
jgi:hypothetical protein